MNEDEKLIQIKKKHQKEVFIGTILVVASVIIPWFLSILIKCEGFDCIGPSITAMVISGGTFVLGWIFLVMGVFGLLTYKDDLKKKEEKKNAKRGPTHKYKQQINLGVFTVLATIMLFLMFGFIESSNRFCSSGTTCTNVVLVIFGIMFLIGLTLAIIGISRLIIHKDEKIKNDYYSKKS